MVSSDANWELATRWCARFASVGTARSAARCSATTFTSLGSSTATKMTSGRLGAFWGFGWLGLGLVCGGGVCVWVGSRKWRVAAGVAPSPCPQQDSPSFFPFFSRCARDGRELHLLHSRQSFREGTPACCCSTLACHGLPCLSSLLHPGPTRPSYEWQCHLLVSVVPPRSPPFFHLAAPACFPGTRGLLRRT